MNKYQECDRITALLISWSFQQELQVCWNVLSCACSHSKAGSVRYYYKKLLLKWWLIIFSTQRVSYAWIESPIFSLGWSMFACVCVGPVSTSSSEKKRMKPTYMLNRSRIEHNTIARLFPLLYGNLTQVIYTLIRCRITNFRHPS